MTGFLTEGQAKKGLLCPLARTFGFEDVEPNCRGSRCACWRWRPLVNSGPEFDAAVEEAKTMLPSDRGFKSPYEFTADNRKRLAAFDAPKTGWCGLGGEPKE